MNDIFDEYGNFIGRFTPSQPSLEGCFVATALIIIATALYIVYKLVLLFVEGLVALFRGDFKRVIINWGILAILGILYISSFGWPAWTGWPVAPAQAQQPQIKETQIRPTPTNIPFPTSPTTLATGETTFEWSYELKGFSGNRDDVYQQIIMKTAPHMSWQQFKDEVLIHNPQLVQDGFEFRKDQTYLLPIEK